MLGPLVLIKTMRRFGDFCSYLHTRGLKNRKLRLASVIHLRSWGFGIFAFHINKANALAANLIRSLNLNKKNSPLPRRLASDLYLCACNEVFKKRRTHRSKNNPATIPHLAVFGASQLPISASSRVPTKRIMDHNPVLSQYFHPTENDCYRPP